MDKYILAEKELAELLGYSRLTYPHFSIDQCWAGFPYGKYKDEEYIPRWARDDAEAFRLTVEHNVCPQEFKGCIWIGNGDDTCFQCEPLENHPDKLTAVRYAIVQAVIAKLKAEKK